MSAHVSDSMPKIIRKIPTSCLEPKLSRSFYFLARDFSLAAALVYGIVAAESWIFGPLLAIVLGFVLTGIFVIGHDAGHRSFSKSNKINDAVGHLTTTLTYWPFHVWRLSHDIHHRYTHHIDREIAWVPFTYEKYQKWSKLFQQFYLLTRSTLFFIGSVFFTLYFIRDARRGAKATHFKESELKQIRLSMLIMQAWLAISVGLSVYFLGVYGFICLILIPQLGFHFWLSTFTLFHHTHDDVHFMSRADWTMEKAQLGSTIHVAYPKFVEWFCHDINWHVPHHVCVGVPHYNLRKAHSALKTAYPDIVREEKISWSLIRKVVDDCHFIKSKNPPDMSWTSKASEESAVQARGLTMIPG